MVRSSRGEKRSAERDSALLGHSYGSAGTRLRKLLLFEYAKIAGLLECYQCDLPLVSVDDFTIEHTVPWRTADDPVKMFYDTSKIAFSHTRCNLGAFSRGKTHCPAGHPYDEDNTYHEAGGQRRCRVCNKSRSRDAYNRRNT